MLNKHHRVKALALGEAAARRPAFPPAGPAQQLKSGLRSRLEGHGAASPAFRLDRHH